MESVLKSSTECKIDELRVGRMAEIGFVNRLSPIVSVYSSSPSLVLPLLSFNAPARENCEKMLLNVEDKMLT